MLNQRIRTTELKLTLATKFDFTLEYRDVHVVAFLGGMGELVSLRMPAVPIHLGFKLVPARTSLSFRIREICERHYAESI